MSGSRLRTGVAAALAVAILAGCAQPTDGIGTAGSVAASTPDFPSSAGSSTASSAPTTDSATPTTAPTSASNATPGDPTAGPLISKLMAPPSGSEPWGDSWSGVVTPSAAQFVSHYYRAAYRTSILSGLRSEGLQALIHRTWVATDDSSADDLLFRFSSADGASARYYTIKNARDDDPDQDPLSFAGSAVGYLYKTKDSEGFYPGVAYIWQGTLVVELFFWIPTSDTTTVDAWVAQQESMITG